jgi:hypothetical protein
MDAFPRSVSGLRSAAVSAGFVVGMLLSACGGTERPPVETPTAADARDFWGLNPESCWRYRYRTSGGTTDVFATVSIQGPDDRRIAGKTIFLQSYQPESGGQPTEYLLDVDTAPGEIRLAQLGEGSGAMRVVRTYDTEPRPLFAKLEFDAQKSVAFAEDIFTTASTPRGETAPVQHKWIVLNKADMAPTPEGMKPAIKLSYERSDLPGTAIYWLVPGYGFASFRDAANTQHDVCAARVCDSSNNCTGAPSCSGLTCSP